MPQAIDTPITSSSRRRALVAGTAVLLAPGGALALPAPDADAALLRLSREAAEADRAYTASCAGGGPASADEAEAAWTRWETAIRGMAALPAAGLTGVAAKVAWILEEMDRGGSVAGAALGASLARDLVRLAPGAMPDAVATLARPASDADEVRA